MKLNILFGLLAALAIGVLFTIGASPTLDSYAGLALVDHALAFGFAGLVINESVLADLFKNIKTAFNKVFTETTADWPKVATLVPSTGSQNDYKWLSNMPRMRKWIGEKFIKALEAFGYTIVNDDFEVTIEVDRNTIEDDNLGIIKPQVDSAAWSAKQLPDELVFPLLHLGFSTPCFDKQFFFDTDHPVKDKNGVVQSISNKGTKVLSCATLAAATASIGAARTAMRKFKDDENRPLHVRPNLLVVPPALEDVALVLKNNERLEDGKQNPYKGTFDVFVCDYLESDTEWFLLDTSKPIKPFIYQERKAPVLVQQTDPQNDIVFMRKKFLFGAEARGAAGYSFWQLAYGSDGTVP